MRILSVVGARPNFMKLGPVHRALSQRGIEHTVVHTGQHFDRGMSDAFFEDLNLPSPDCNLGIGSGSHAQQTAGIMQRLEPMLFELKPDIVVVYGDVNSTVAAALVASKLGIRIAHVEAGLRSRDWSMPEEINRVVTDRLSDLLFTPSRDADANLLREGIQLERIHFVGNVMIDSLVQALPKAMKLNSRTQYALGAGEYVVVTLHRPSNVDDADTLSELIRALGDIGRSQTVLFPVHPRTQRTMDSMSMMLPRSVTGLQPLPYLQMLSLVRDAALVITDSGGLQEETSFLGVPCVTVRSNTERPVTISEGTNQLVDSSYDSLIEGYRNARGRRMECCTIELWDGNAGDRIASVLTGNPAVLRSR